jgi:hypothetical protein
MEEAHAALLGGRYLETVRKCADSYLSLLQSRPEVMEPGSGIRPGAWPRLGVRLTLDERGSPDMVWERDRFALSEAITYFEFTLDQLIIATRN